MTERVQAGCSVAMDFCSTMWDHKGVLEVAIHLGKLEGVWAKIFHRRFKMIEDLVKEFGDAWKEVVANLDMAGLVTAFRREMGLEEGRGTDWIRRAKAAARDLAMQMLSWLRGKPGWQTVRDLLRKIVISGRAEGYASAIAAAAASQGRVGMSFDIAFEHAFAALENLGDTWAEADSWLERMLGGNADELGRALGSLAAEGADYEQMVAAGLDILDDVSDSSIVSFIIDWALTTGLARGALDLYASEGVAQVSWMTAGDGRVCALCESYEEASPYPITDFPSMPAHPNCRCVPSAEFDTDSFGDFFI